MVDGWAAAIEVVEPEARTLSWENTGGTVALAWRGEGSRCWLEYELLGATATGALLGAVDGSFLVEQSRVVFGPVPEGFWRDVASYAPLRLRVVDPERRERSRWVELEIE